MLGRVKAGPCNVHPAPWVPCRAAPGYVLDVACGHFKPNQRFQDCYVMLLLRLNLVTKTFKHPSRYCKSCKPRDTVTLHTGHSLYTKMTYGLALQRQGKRWYANAEGSMYSLDRVVLGDAVQGHGCILLPGPLVAFTKHLSEASWGSQGCRRSPSSSSGSLLCMD
jgi:hypothetical protein